MVKSTYIKDRIVSHLKAEAASSVTEATPFELWRALSRTLIELMSDHWEESTRVYQKGRAAHYFSAEFLVGRALINNLINLDIYKPVKQAVADLGMNLDELAEQENDPGLGNGGLGRLAACFLDSCATGNLPVAGYGLLYRYGLFHQKIEDGFQKEYPDAWMEREYPFLVRRDQDKVRIHYKDMDVFAVPYDMPITGYKTKNVNTLRLWAAEPAEEFDFNLFNSQRFDDAVVQRNRVDDIFRVLYPNDTSYDGKVLRVRQQYFFVSASLQSIVKKYALIHGDDFSQFASMNKIQLNDTHPVVAIPELMRILTTEIHMDWDQAWDITKETFAYTNHTIMAEALEKWDTGIFQYLFPWIYEIVERIDYQFREEMRVRGLHVDEINYLAPLGDGKVRMAWLAVYGSTSVNGVAALHTDILKSETLKQFYQLWPEKFSNKTNGVTPRRWLKAANPLLADLLTEVSGDEAWITDLDRLKALAPLKKDDKLMRRLIKIKRKNKIKLAERLQQIEHITVNPDAVFDIQIKRLHEYKRQLLNALLILDQYFELKDNPEKDVVPAVYLFGAKAAPGYFRAKSIIKFINEIARMVNQDPDVKDKIQIHFIENYNVSWAEKLFPAADVSEQISTVGMEASGTGNMKFMMNGALTIGTCDGANVEIQDAVQPENSYIFGCQVEHFQSTKDYYNPQWQYQHIKGLKRCVDTLIDGTFNDGGTGMFQDLYNGLVYGSDWQPADPFYVLGDFEDYRVTRQRLMNDYRDELDWARKCWTNITNSGRFSSDRTISEYAKDIWQVDEKPLQR